MKMLECLQFSLPISVEINAPADVAWEVLTDVPSYPSWLSSVVSVEPITRPSSGSSVPTRSSTLSRGGSSSCEKQSAAKNAAAEETGETIRGTKWRITRLSLLERRRYTGEGTVTRFLESEDERSFTTSMHQMLGAACSLKIVVEAAGRPGGAGNGDGSSDRREDGDLPRDEPDPRSASDPPRSARSDHQPSQAENGKAPPRGSSSASPTSPSPRAASSSSRCRVTAIMTMIPYQCSFALLGISCCMCLLRARARMAMESDLEDVKAECEGRMSGK